MKTGRFWFVVVVGVIVGAAAEEAAADSDLTVSRALNWLARRQNADGSWSFDGDSPNEAAQANRGKGRFHRNADGSWRFDGVRPERAAYTNPGKCRSKCGATALVLLCFAGIGQTHRSKWPYQENTQAGVKYLLDQAARDSGKSDLRGEGGDMRCHAAAVLALSELYQITGDKAIVKPLQKALDFIVAHQDQETGGWALEPGQTPTTSATAWQLLAIHSAMEARLPVSPAVLQRTAAVKRAAAFLDRMQSDDEAFYGETRPGKEPAATAMALFSRLTLGWKADRPAVKRGVEYLAELGPSKTDVVYNWSTTLLLHAVSGPLWDKWSERLRRQSIESQSKDSAEGGSWWTPGDVHASEGGRLMQTALTMSCMEVYYRYLPLYRWEPGAK